MKIMHAISACILLLCVQFDLSAQEPHKVYSFTIKESGDQLTLSYPKLLTGYNPAGYNNQPHFKAARKLYLTSMLEREKTTDIYALDLFTKKKHQVTHTPEAEYSPQLRPGTKNFTCVRVESDGETQRLWEFPTNQSTQGKPLFPEVKNVGYYYWMNRHEVMMFLVGDPHSLVKGDTRDDSIVQVTSNIGRGMGKTINDEFLYVQKLSEKTWYIKSLDISTLKSTIITETLDEAEDFTILSDGRLLMASKSSLYLYDPNNSKEWEQVADLSKYGLKNITRMAYNNDRILVVVD